VADTPSERLVIPRVVLCVDVVEHMPRAQWRRGFDVPPIFWVGVGGRRYFWVARTCRRDML
jgi:hypothetical protein